MSQLQETRIHPRAGHGETSYQGSGKLDSDELNKHRNASQQ